MDSVCLKFQLVENQKDRIIKKQEGRKTKIKGKISTDRKFKMQLNSYKNESKGRDIKKMLYISTINFSNFRFPSFLCWPYGFGLSNIPNGRKSKRPNSKKKTLWFSAFWTYVFSNLFFRIPSFFCWPYGYGLSKIPNGRKSKKPNYQKKNTVIFRPSGIWPLRIQFFGC